MSEPNMTVDGLEQWTSTEAYRDYADDHDDVKTVIDRTRRVLEGTASNAERQKVKSFISRMKQNDAGEPVNGSGPTAVSNRTASLRNWGYDPTERFA